MCFRVCKVIFMGLLKIVVKLLLKAFTWSHQSCIEVFSMQLLVLTTLKSYTYEVFCEVVDECSKTRDVEAAISSTASASTPIASASTNKKKRENDR